MDLLFGLFDVATGLGELLSRSDDKCQELASLSSDVQSITQSVRTFAESLAAEERDDAFNSNQVFPQLVTQLQQCQSIITKNQGVLAPAIANGDAELQKQLEDTGSAATTGRPSAVRAIRKSLSGASSLVSKATTEGLQVIGGKLSSLSGGFLPEDELECIRKAAQDLNKLVPQLVLAVSVYRPRHPKRGFEMDAAPPARPLQEPRRLHSADVAAGRGGGFTALQDGPSASEGSNDVPLLQLQLVSDHEAARTGPVLPVLTTTELRPASAASTFSLDSNGSDGQGGAQRRLLFGRQELRKVPKNITLTANNTVAPISRFVSRDLFVLDVPLKPLQAEEPEDSLNMATLAFGAADDSAFDDCGGATLAWGDHAAPPAQPVLAVAEVALAMATGLTTGGLHVRAKGKTRWQWMTKDKKVEIFPGDRIAILLESPPGSSNPGPARDLEAEEAVCLLGIELQPPPPPPPSS